MNSKKEYKILYIKPGYVPPPDNPEQDEFFHLSERLGGHVLNPVWDTHFKSSFTRNTFTYHLFRSWKIPKPFRSFADLLFYILKGLTIYYFNRDKYDAIVSFGTNKTGVGALILKMLTGAKLIIDVPGNPSKYFISHEKVPPLSSRVKHHIGIFLFRLIAGKADMLKLLYPTQLEGFPSLKNSPRRIFFAIAPLSHIELKDPADDNFIFFLGSPWYLKGVDILISAFHLIKDEFPDIKLKIAGYTENPEEFYALAKNDPRIEFIVPGVPNTKALEIFSRCSLFVLPSRTEAMGRVLLEAMAFRKPVIGTNVDGIPTIVKDSYNGLLFEKENAEDLASKIRTILSNPALAKTLGKNGRKFVLEETSNERYIELFHEMVKSSLS